MTELKQHLYVSYTQQDAQTVTRFVKELAYALREYGSPIGIWMDRQALTPGADWQKSIEEAIRSSFGVLVFLSPTSTRSEWVQREVEAAVADKDRLIIPIVLGDLAHGDVTSVKDLNFVRLKSPTSEQMAQAAQNVARGIASWLEQHPQTPPPLAAPEAKKFAADAAESIRAATSRQTEDDRAPPDSVFVVHGHDADALTAVCNVLSEFSVRPVVLSQIEGPVQSLLQKFFSTSKEARFAIVILTSDDYGASRVQYEADGVADRALSFGPARM